MQQRVENGVIDWTKGELRAVGVGTPRILSPTGGVTDDSPEDNARQDAERRLGKLIGRLPWNQRERLSQHPEWLSKGLEASRQLTASSLRRSSDGTVHLHASVQLTQLVKQVAPTSVPTTDEQPLTPKVLIELDKRIRPCVHLSTRQEAIGVLELGFSTEPNASVRPLFWRYSDPKPAPDSGMLTIGATVQQEPNGSVLLSLAVPPEKLSDYLAIAKRAEYTILLPRRPSTGRKQK